MDDRERTARRTFDQVTAAGENVVQDVQSRYAEAIENASDLNAKLVEMANANAKAAVDATAELASAKNPADFTRAWSTHAAKQFAMFAGQARELTAAWQTFLVPPR